MNKFTLRPATKFDARAIRALIYAARINPMGLDWRRFIVASLKGEGVIGCGQMKTHADGSRELASLAVTAQWQGQGIASALVMNLQASHPKPIYLTCRASLGPFYERFDFRTVREDELPPYFRRLQRWATVLRVVPIMREDLLIMIWG